MLMLNVNIVVKYLKCVQGSTIVDEKMVVLDSVLLSVLGLIIPKKGLSTTNGVVRSVFVGSVKMSSLFNLIDLRMEK